MLEQDKKDPNPNKKQKLDEHQIDDNVGGVDDPREEEKAGPKPPFSDNEEMEVDDGPACCQVICRQSGDLWQEVICVKMRNFSLCATSKIFHFGV